MSTRPLRIAAALALAAAVSGCGPSYEVLAIHMTLAAPSALIPVTTAGGLSVSVGDVRAASGTFDVDTRIASVTVRAHGLAPVPSAIQALGFKHRVWARDQDRQPMFLGDVDVDPGGHVLLRKVYYSDPPPLAFVREAVIVLWPDASPAPVDPAGEPPPMTVYDSGIVHRHSQPRPGWALVGDVVDRPARATDGGVHVH